MFREVTLVRHGETVSNVAGIWQGHGNSGFSPRGREQVKRLADRLSPERFDLVVSSDLGRAQATAGATKFDFESSPEWREMHLGVWEGLTREEVLERFPDEVAAFQEGRDITIGGGESLEDLRRRTVGALEDLAGRLDSGGRALVVAHGGPIMSVVADALGVSRHSRSIHRVINTAIARIRFFDDGTRQLAVFNDATHLNGEHDGFGRVSQVVVVRHGETVANIEGRWQGRQNGRLTGNGLDQIRRLASWVPQLDALYSSPATRALATAAVVADRQEQIVRPIDGLAEIDFGAWEGLTASEIAQRFPDQWTRFRVEGIDEPRGASGETFQSAGRRMAETVEKLVANHPGETVGIVSHGGVTRAYIAALMGFGFADRNRLALPHNTSMTRIVFGEAGPSLAEYNLVPHLAG